MNAIGKGAEQVKVSPEDLLEQQLGHTIDREAFRKSRRLRLLQAIDLQPIRPGVVSLATEANQQNLNVAIASSSYHNWVDGYLSKHGILGLFNPIVCSDDAARGKPHPDIYLEALARMAIRPEQAIALEDSPNGIKAAKAAGLFAIAVPNPVSKLLDLSQADARLDTLEGVTLQDLENLRG